MEKRIEAIDLCKGLAILFVYLEHSILYYPIVESIQNSMGCHILKSCITSFNMPLFFIISGFLFYGTTRNGLEIIKKKVIKLLVPFLCVMAVVIAAKLILPTDMACNKQAGIKNVLVNIFLYGGDRWFVYVLFLLFLIIAAIKPLISHPKVGEWYIIGIQLGTIILSIEYCTAHFFIKQSSLFLILFPYRMSL